MTQNIQAVERAMKILETVGEMDGCGVSDLSRDLDMNKSTVFGLIKTLKNLGYLFKDEDTDKYYLTSKCASLSKNNNDHELIKFAKISLNQLVDKYNETVHFAKGEPGEINYLDKIESKRSVVVITNVGQKMPLHCSGLGKSILANRSDEDVRNYERDYGLKKFTDYTITDIDQLIENINGVRERGYAIDDREREEELYCFAVALDPKVAHGEYSVSISIPYFRKDDYEKEEVIRDLQRVKKAIEGYFH